MFTGLQKLYIGSQKLARLDGFNTAYQRAKSKFGIITSLPVAEGAVEQTDEQPLKFYLKSKRNREDYWEEIRDLIDKRPELRVTYDQEMGRIHPRHYRK